MDLPLWVYLTLIIATLIFSAFFSGMEIAFISANKLQIEVDRKQGVFSAYITSIFSRRPSWFIATMLLGNNAALVVYGVLMGDVLTEPIALFVSSEAVVLLLQTIITTFIILITAEFLPKTFFRANPNFWLNTMAMPLIVIYVALFIPMIITIGISNLFLKIFRVDTSPNKVAFGRVDLNDFIKEVSDRVENKEEVDHEIQIFRNALDFSKVRARECMVPRTEISAVNIDDNISVLREKFIDSGHTKIMVYRDTIDNLIGFVHSYELFKAPSSIASILLPASIIPESMHADKVLEELIKQNRSVAVVVDEFGGTGGIVTIEDIMEEIFGEIEDEHDVEEMVEEEISPIEFVLSGRLEVDYLNEKYDLNLPESEDYDTLAGYIIQEYENIPELHTQIEIDRFHFTITEVSDKKIDLVRLKVIEVD